MWALTFDVKGSLKTSGPQSKTSARDTLVLKKRFKFPFGLGWIPADIWCQTSGAIKVLVE